MGIEKYIDNDLLSRFEFHNYGHALEILHDAFPTEWMFPYDHFPPLLRRD